MNEINGDFRIKLLSGGKVILVECAGFEPELFVPIVKNSRVTLQNAIVQRRCFAAKSTGILKPVENTPKLSIRQQSPLAKSTPAKKGASSQTPQSPIRRFPTPDIVRRVALQTRKTAVRLPSLGPGLKVVPLHRNHTPNTPQKLARITQFSKTHSPLEITGVTHQAQFLQHLSNVSSIRTPPRLLISNLSNCTIISRSPNESFLLRTVNTSQGSATKWRKCITPKRTYIRPKNGVITSVALKRFPAKPIPIAKSYIKLSNFRTNVTDERIYIKKRKLIIDKCLTIPTGEFKNQLKSTSDLNRSNFQFPKTRKQYIHSQQTAFDLLTNSCYYPRISNSLNSLFRQGCQNRQAETVMKYKLLIADIPQVKAPT